MPSLGIPILFKIVIVEVGSLLKIRCSLGATFKPRIAGSKPPVFLIEVQMLASHLYPSVRSACSLVQPARTAYEVDGVQAVMKDRAKNGCSIRSIDKTDGKVGTIASSFLCIAELTAARAITER